jgi:hypothetical protein
MRSKQIAGYSSNLLQGAPQCPGLHLGPLVAASAIKD